MHRISHRIGAVFYALWGLLHVAGGAAILATLNMEGGPAALAMLGTGAPSEHLLSSTTPVVNHLMAYHAFNILWIGLFATTVAVLFNWKNSLAGYWVNLVVVSVFDLGLLVFEVLPGSIAVGDAMVGVVLWIPAVAFSTLGIRFGAKSRNEQPASLALETNLTP